jgi:hypothetical protein
MREGRGEKKKQNRKHMSKNEQTISKLKGEGK